MATINDSATLFVHGHEGVNSYATLMTWGHEPLSDVITLYAQGGYGLTLDADSPLHTVGHDDLNSYATLQVTGMIEANGGITLFTDSIGVYNRIGYLFVEGHLFDLNSYAPLHILGGTPGTYGSDSTLPLILDAAFQRGMPLFIQNDESNVPISEGRFLYIAGTSYLYNGSVDLYLQNDAIDGSVTLLIVGEGTTPGYLPAERGIPLFINRPDESTFLNLFCKALDDWTNSYITLHVRSAIEETGAITLAIPNVAAEGVNTYATLTTTGMIVSSGSVTLATDAHGEMNGTMTLVAKQETSLLNTYVNMYVAGAYLDNASMTLAMPEVTDSSTGTVPFYVFGW